MKKLFFLLLLATFLFQFKANAKGFKAGINAAFVASDVYGVDVVADNDVWNNTDFYKMGFMFGGAVSRMIGKKSALQLEINYIQKGTKQLADSNGNGFYDFSFNYVEIPVIYKHRLHIHGGKKDINGFELYAGISIGKLVSNKAETGNEYSVNDHSYLNTTDVSLLAGVGYNFSEHFNFSFRYSNSVIPVFKRNAASPVFLSSSFNTGDSLVLHFILQYLFGGSKNNTNQANENK